MMTLNKKDKKNLSGLIAIIIAIVMLIIGASIENMTIAWSADIIAWGGAFIVVRDIGKPIRVAMYVLLGCLISLFFIMWHLGFVLKG